MRLASVDTETRPQHQVFSCFWQARLGVVPVVVCEVGQTRSRCRKTSSSVSENARIFWQMKRAAMTATLEGPKSCTGLFLRWREQNNDSSIVPGRSKSAMLAVRAWRVSTKALRGPKASGHLGVELRLSQVLGACASRHTWVSNPVPWQD